MAAAVLDGVEALLGLAKCTPVVGHRRELDPDAGDKLVPGYFALIDSPKIDPRTLWVRDNHLLVGPSLDRAIEFRDADYVLMSLASTPEREGESKLPFYPLWEKVQKEAMHGSDDAFKIAKASMATLNETLMLSPDLTEAHAANLSTKYTTIMVERHRRVEKIKNASANDDDRAADRRRKSLSILDLE